MDPRRRDKLPRVESDEQVPHEGWRKRLLLAERLLELLRKLLRPPRHELERERQQQGDRELRTQGRSPSGPLDRLKTKAAVAPDPVEAAGGTAAGAPPGVWEERGSDDAGGRPAEPEGGRADGPTGAGGDARDSHVDRLYSEYKKMPQGLAWLVLLLGSAMIQASGCCCTG